MSYNIRCALHQNLGLDPAAYPAFVEQARQNCQCGACMHYRSEQNARYAPQNPIVFLPLMTKPAREVEKGTKYLPEMWRPDGSRNTTR